jgi:iron(III) transport system permease protein
MSVNRFIDRSRVRGMWRGSRLPSAFGMLGLVLTLAAVALIVYPLISTFADAFTRNSALDLSAFWTVLTDTAFHKAVLDTLIILVTAGPLALFIGAVFAWLNERTDARFGWVSTILPIVPLLVPSIAMSVGWVFLGNSRAGFLNTLIRTVCDWGGIHAFDESGPVNISTWPGLIFVYTIVLVPYAYLVVASALRNTDSSLEEASRMCGAGVLTTLVRVSLPAIRPALASSALLILIMGLSLFSIPRTIGTAAGIDTVSVYLVRLTQSFPSRLNEAVAVSVLLLIVMAGAWWVQQRASSKERHSTISGKTGSASVIKLGRWRLLARIVMILYIVCVSVLPFVALVIVALQPFWTSTINFSALTIANFSNFFGAAGALPRQALMTSMLLGVIGATVAMAGVTIMVSYGRDHRRFVRKLVEGVTKAPGAISHIVFGVAVLVTFAGPPFHLSGTIVILLLAYIIVYMPQASTSAEVARGQVGSDLLEASAMLGASKSRTFRSVLFPLMLPGLAAGWALLFVMIVGDLTVSAILAGTNNPVVSFVFLDIWDNGTFSVLATLGTLVSLVTTAVVLLALFVGRRSVLEGGARGGI